MKLVYQDGYEVSEGDLVVDFRGDKWLVEGWSEPHKPSSSGRVHVTHFTHEYRHSFFPTVFDMKWEDQL